MRRGMLFGGRGSGLLFAVAALMLLVFSGASRAGGPGPLTSMYLLTNVQVDNPVEEQTDWATPDQNCGGFAWWPCDRSLWVTNPFVGVPCAWDADDHWLQQGRGYLAPGATFTVDECRVAEATSIYKTNYGVTGWWSNNPRPLGASVYAPSGNLNVSLCFAPQGRCFTIAAVYQKAVKQWVYQACVAVSYDPNDPEIVLVPNSGKGGYGVVTTATFTVTNPTGKRVNSVVATFAAVGWADSEAGCAYQTQWPHYSYPFSWVERSS